jgi:hypothetical protein
MPLCEVIVGCVGRSPSPVRARGTLGNFQGSTNGTREVGSRTGYRKAYTDPASLLSPVRAGCVKHWRESKRERGRRHGVVGPPSQCPGQVPAAHGNGGRAVEMAGATCRPSVWPLSRSDEVSSHNRFRPIWGGPVGQGCAALCSQRDVVCLARYSWSDGPRRRLAMLRRTADSRPAHCRCREAGGLLGGCPGCGDDQAGHLQQRTIAGS